jgi:hypothetical protein
MLLCNQCNTLINKLCYFLQGIASLTGAKAPASYQPDYTRCADHFLLHAGGYAILRGIQKGLRLPADKMLPSFASLRDFGNTSSASTWYTWSYIESTMGVKKGETILQVRCCLTMLLLFVDLGGAAVTITDRVHHHSCCWFCSILCRT